MSRYQLTLISGLIALATCALGADEAKDFPAPANALPMEETGALAGYQQGYMQIRDSHMDLWLLQIVPETKVTIEGDADADYLRPGQSVQFEGQVDDKLALEAPIKQIEIPAPAGKTLAGFYPLDKSGAASRPIKKPAAGTWLVKGKVVSAKDGALVVAVGRGRVTGDLDDKTVIKVTSDDPSVAALGDAVKVKAWYFENTKPMPRNNVAGRAIAEEITITLTDLPELSGKRGRAAQRPAKAAAKNVKEVESEDR